MPPRRSSLIARFAPQPCARSLVPDSTTIPLHSIETQSHRPTQSHKNNMRSPNPHPAPQNLRSSSHQFHLELHLRQPTQPPRPHPTRPTTPLPTQNCQRAACEDPRRTPVWGRSSGAEREEAVDALEACGAEGGEDDSEGGGVVRVGRKEEESCAGVRSCERWGRRRTLSWGLEDAGVQGKGGGREVLDCGEDEREKEQLGEDSPGVGQLIDQSRTTEFKNASPRSTTFPSPSSATKSTSRTMWKLSLP